MKKAAFSKENCDAILGVIHPLETNVYGSNEKERNQKSKRAGKRYKGKKETEENRLRKTGIWASGLGFGPQDRDLGLKTKIWASRLGFEGGTKKKKKEEEKKKIPHMCESIQWGSWNNSLNWRKVFKIFI